MATLKAIRQVYDRDAYFKERILSLVSTTIYELKKIYMSTYAMQHSPFLGCHPKEKALVISYMPNIKVEKIYTDHPILGKAVDYVAYKY